MKNESPDASSHIIVPAVAATPAAGAANRHIDALLREGRLKEALDLFYGFLDDCEKQRNDLVLLLGKWTNLNTELRASAITADDIEFNRLRLSVQNLVSDFRKYVLARTFDIRGQEEFLNSITDRDAVIEEVLALRLRPKRYEIDPTWEKREGNSSIIYRLINIDTRRHAICMLFKLGRIDEPVKNTIEYLTDLRHRNVIKVLDHETSAFPFYVITEYVYGESLPAALDVAGPRPLAQAADWLYQLTDGLDYLRHKRILHTNVRPSKIYIDDEWQVMISPFDLLQMTPTSRGPAGASVGFERTFNRYRDVCQYGSPELLARDGEGFNDLRDMCVSDLYSLGLIGYKILTGADLFDGASIHAILANRTRFATDRKYRAARLSMLPPSKLSDIIVQLLTEDAAERAIPFPTLNQLLRQLHPLTRADSPKVSETRASYRRCLANNREFFRDFYRNFLENSPHAPDFDDRRRRRQSAMLQMAVDVLLDLDSRQNYLLKLIHSDNTVHAKYSVADFEAFLDTLIATVSQNDPQWNEPLAEAWADIRERAMAVIRRERP